MTYNTVMDALGDNPEYGGERRITLPASKYIARLAIDELGMTGGGTPYVQLFANVLEGPFKGQDVRARVYITPGGSDSKGGHIGFVNAATTRITRKQPDATALNDLGVKFPDKNEFDEEEDWRAACRIALRDAFAEADEEKRLAWAAKYARLKEWDGKNVVVVFGVEPNQDNTRMFNKMNGFYALDDTKYGASYVRGVCHAEQEEARAEMVARGEIEA